MGEIIAGIGQILKDFGFPTALAGAVIYGMFKVIMYLLEQSIVQYKGQVDRLAAENREYREIFVAKIKGMDDTTHKEIDPKFPGDTKGKS